MDEDRIGLVLARASELRTKITNCIQKSSSFEQREDTETEYKDSGKTDPDDDDGDEEEEAESLLNIRDALESLEAQLSSLQALQQQQWYEKEAALAEIEHSQKKLLVKLKEYRGKDLEVIHEATAFASETVEDNDDLLLPPYPSRPRTLVSDNGYLSHFPSARKFAQNGVTSGGSKSELTKDLDEAERMKMQSESGSKLKLVKSVIGSAAKAALTVVGVVSVLTLAGFEPRLRRRDNNFKSFNLFQQQEIGEERPVACPPGKVPVLENGEIRCLVKERIEIPFKSVVATPDVNYGCG